MYTVLEYFEDLKDNRREYNVGDTYPAKGVKASKARINELSTNTNMRGRPVIAIVEKKTDEDTNQ